MNITHIIGNGFDINQGIPTSYAHFYEYYLQLMPAENESEVVKQFQVRMYNELLEHQTEKWSDMEKGLGVETMQYSSAGDFETVYMHVYNHLMEYIDYAYRLSDVAKFDNPEKTIYQDLIKPWQHLVPSDIEQVEMSFKRVNDVHVRILSFNYTDTFNRVSDLQKRVNGVLGMEHAMTYHYDGCIHIHHALSTHDIILGVDNTDQIANKELAKYESIGNLIVKPQTNHALGTLIDRQCKDTISYSDIISIYGVSLGETDATWWKEIGKRIKSDLDVRVLYFPFEKEIAHVAEIQKPTLRTKYKHQLMDALGIDRSNRKNYENRIFVNFCNNPGGRNIFSNPKKESLSDNFENVMSVLQKEGKIVTPKPVPKTLSGLISPLLQPYNPLYKPRNYRAKNLLIDNANTPF